MDKFQAAVYAISITVVVAVIWVCFFNIMISDQAAPTLVNGVASSMSVIVGFCGTIIGIMFREISANDDSKVKETLLVFIILLMIPIAMLWTTYSSLASGQYGLAIRISLSGLLSALHTFICLVILIAKISSSKTEKKPQTIPTGKHN